MNRRRFLKVAGIAGLSVMAPIAAREVYAGANKYKGPFWIMVNAGGGWDPTMLCDPKGGTAGDVKSVDQAYAPGSQGTAGHLQYAPIDYQSNGATVYSAKAFFEAHHGRLLVANGVDTSTNNHDAGSRTTWSGQLAEGYPSFAAMAAAAVTQAQPVPLAYVSYGGYDATAGVLSLTRVGNPGSLENLAFVNEMNPSDPKTDTFHTNNTLARIQAAQAGRIRALAAKQTLPRIASGMNSLYLARGANDGLAALGDALKSVKLVTTDDFADLKGVQNLGDLTNLMQQAQLALLCFKTGVAVSVNISYGGFDTHNDSDNKQKRQMMILMRALDYLFNQIDAQGLASQVYVVVGSDFGRTPYYNNNNNGKDHWNITSMLFSGPKIPGDKVIGGTDAGFTSIDLDKSTLQPKTGGVRITTTNVHQSLRELAGLTNSDLDRQFPLPGDPLPLFA